MKLLIGDNIYFKQTFVNLYDNVDRIYSFDYIFYRNVGNLLHRVWRDRLCV